MAKDPQKDPLVDPTPVTELTPPPGAELANEPDAGVGAQEELETRETDTDPEISEARRTFVHDVSHCGQETTISEAEFRDLYANPSRYQGLFCNHCGVAIRLGEEGELHWKGSKTKVLAENDSLERHG